MSAVVIFLGCTAVVTYLFFLFGLAAGITGWVWDKLDSFPNIIATPLALGTAGGVFATAIGIFAYTMAKLSGEI